MRILLLACLTAFGWFGESQVPVEKDVVAEKETVVEKNAVSVQVKITENILKTPVIKPIWTSQTPDLSEDREFLKKYKIVPTIADYPQHPDNDPNEDYRKAYPYDEILLDRINGPADPRKPGGSRQVRAVLRDRRLMDASPGHLGGWDGKHETIWRWEVPKKLQSFEFCLGFQRSSRFSVLGFIPDEQKTNPWVCSFDAESGLRWQTEVPYQALLQQFAQTPDVKIRTDVSPVPGYAVCVSNDGACTLFMLNTNPPEYSALIALDAEGRVSAARFLPGVNCASRITQDPAGTRMVLTMRDIGRHLKETGKYPEVRVGVGDYLVDRNANLIGRFSDGSDAWIGITEMNSEYAYGVRVMEDLTTRRYIFKLPK